MAASDSEDDFADFGTPLEPLDEDAIPRKKPVSIEEQFARDKHGRRRFHGAFTGGFSAGFLNTVGSMEGWKPTSFISSRSVKGVFSAQKPEHFMDEEDMGEHGIAPTILQAKEDYISSNRKRKIVDFTEGPIPGKPVLNDILQPVRETVGIKLLKQMGWKPGQGIGPRLSKKDKSHAARKIYGCMLPPDSEGKKDDSDSDSDLDWDNIQFAPDDYEPFLCKPKENSFGIGYVGLDRTPILGQSSYSEIKFQEKNRKVHIRGQAFGVGAFEEEDEDIYTHEDMSQYDFSIGKKDKETKFSNKETNIPGVIEGFIPAVKKRTKKYFAPPSLPKGFNPSHKIKTSRFEAAPENEQKKEKGRHDLSRGDRGVLLGEHNEPTTSDDQAKARKLTEELVAKVPLAQSGFRPFVLNPEKQKRYEQYLKLVNLGKRECLKDLQPSSMTEWDREREKREFEQAAKLFKPLSGVMGDRFTTASQSDDSTNPLVEVAKSQHGNESQRSAAKMKMYGKLTREVSDWRPASLLCKRFNIPEPLVSDSLVPKKTKTKLSIFDCLDSLSVKTEPKSEVCKEPDEGIRDQTPAEEESVVPNEPIVLTEVKDKTDLYKAVFLDTDDEEEETQTDTGETTLETTIQFEDNLVNQKRNTSPARGLFENIDLEMLTKKSAKNPVTEFQNEELLEEEEATPVVESDISSEMYGPKLPDRLIPKTLPVNSPTRSVSSSSSEDCWVEKDSADDKHKKKKKKSKKSKHKRKHNHKNKKRK